nr:VCBS repeat-containing protein [Ardenticatena sp.]
MAWQLGWHVDGFISTPPVVADVDGDGTPEVVVAADALYVWRWDGTLLPGFPVWGRNAFASRPAVTDLDGDGCPEIVVGCDDNALYAVRATGVLQPGWPVWTRGDVYSSPTLADLDGDGLPEVVVGSDDGGVYVVDAQGHLLPGWPQSTHGFVAASPTVADVDGDGALEVVAASWDGAVYVWRTDGRLLAGWPRITGHFVWASPVVADVDGDGMPEIVAASDALYVWRSNGRMLAGWPRPLQGYAVAQPLVADVDGDGVPEIVQASDTLYAWRADGSPLDGFPLALPAFVWGQPLCLPAMSGLRLLMGAWDGRVYAVDAAAPRLCVLASLGAPLFAPLTRGLGTQVLAATWAGDVWLGDGAMEGLPAAPAERLPWVMRTLAPATLHVPDVPENTPVFVQVAVSPMRRAVLWYRADHEHAWHPVPLVRQGGRLMGLVQPFPAGRQVRLFVDLWPDEGGALPVEGRLWQDAPPTVGKRLPPAPHVWTYRTHPVLRERLHRRTRRLWRRFTRWMRR